MKELMTKVKKAPMVIVEEDITNKIHHIRGKKVMLDSDLAILYQVETKQLKRQVRRNIKRFPRDFMFELTKQELNNLRSQNGTSSLPDGKSDWGGMRHLPMAFTEQGIAMLSSVLNSQTAIRVNIQIIRIFTRMRELLLTHKDLMIQMDEIQKRIGTHDEKIELIFNYLKQFIQGQSTPRKKIGFRRSQEN